MKYTRNGEDYRKTRWTTADLSGEYIGLANNFTQGFRYNVMEKPKETFWPTQYNCQGLPWWLSGKEYVCQCRRHRFNPRVEKIPCRRKQQGRIRWWRSRQTWSIFLSTDTSRIHLQRQKILQNTGREQAAVPDHWKRIYRACKIH